MEEKKKKVIILIVMVLLLVGILIGVTYAAFTFSKAGTTENVITTGAVTMIYTEGDNQITINNAMPMTADVGKALSDEDYVFDFTIDIKTGPSMPISYEVTALKDFSSTLENSDVRLYLQKSLDGTNYDDEVLEPSPYIPLENDDQFGAKAGEMVLDVGSVDSKVIYYYRLRMWVDSSYELSSVSKSFTVKVNAYGKDGIYIKERDPNPPELVGDMIPVIYDDTNGSWIKSSTNRGEWFDYSNQKWANAVTIKDATKRAVYTNANIGTSIPTEDINTFMVWIPRYSYTLGNTYGYQMEGADTPSQATPGAFDIKFVSKNTTEMGSGEYTGDTPENYFTPSSFCWGDTCDDEATRKDAGNKELSGIWVSKFEVTGMGDSVSLVPDSSIQTQIYNVADYFKKIQTTMNGESGLNNYGFNGSYDTHMIKNTEWGAFAYLSQSKYGRYGNSNLVDKTFMYYSIPYEVDLSTTGNMSGIMGRINWSNYVMGNYNNIIGNVRFDTMPQRRYYNLYTDEIYSIKGDTMFGNDDHIGFYVNNNYRTNADYPWVIRMDNTSSSTMKWLFHFNGHNGFGSGDRYTRFVLVSN